MIITTNGPQNVGQVKKQFEHGNLFLSPEEYQRESAWNLEQKKLLIDTIFRGMDIPKLYFWKIDHHTLIDGYPDGETKEVYKEILERKRKENDDPDPYIYEVVDGQQRIRTILEYIGVTPPNSKVYRGFWNQPFESLEDSPIAKGKMYSQLNAEQQTKFDEARLTIMVLERANIDEIRDMFLRLQNGTPLNAQQKRDAMGSNVGSVIRDLASLSFFTKTVNFDNRASAHHLVASQMLHLELKGKIVSCTSRQLDKLYEQYKKVPVDSILVTRTKKIITMLGKIFPQKNPHLNRSYAVSLYWALSRILEVYNIPENDYQKIQGNFETLDLKRLEAMSRDYSDIPHDEIYRDLSDSMSRRTDGADGIADRHDLISQFLFEGVNLTQRPALDPKRLFTHEEKLILYRKANGLCQLEHNGVRCGHLIDFDDAVVDHIIPHGKGGKTELGNGRITHRACNNARGSRDDFDPRTMCHLQRN